MAVTMKQPILMIPGPIDVPDEVRRRCGSQVIPHYDPPTGYPALYRQVSEKMKPIFGLTGGSVILANGSGSIAVNMALASFCAPDDNILVVCNGAFGEYGIKNVKALGLSHTVVHGPWNRGIDPDDVRREMKKKHHAVIYVTHNESSTALVNRLSPLAVIAREHDALLIVDSISAIGGMTIGMGGEDGADIVAGASQKCLELPPGLAPLAISDRAWEFLDRMKNRRVPWVLDVAAWRNALRDQWDYHPQLVTSMTNTVWALDYMIDRIMDEGLENRQERFNTAGLLMKAGMAELGFYPTAHPEDASPVVTSFQAPPGIEGETLRAYYMERHNTMVGWGYIRDTDEAALNRTFRVAHFGRAADPDRIEHMITITRQFVEERNRA